MGLELGSDGTFKYFGEKWEIGDWLEVIHDIGIETRFLQDGRWPDSSQFA